MAVSDISTSVLYGSPSGRSERWMRVLGDAFERREPAEAFTDRELARLVPRLDWAVPLLREAELAMRQIRAGGLGRGLA